MRMKSRNSITIYVGIWGVERMDPLWDNIYQKMIKSKRKWDYAENLPYRFVKLYCVDCGEYLGEFDGADLNLEGHQHCSKCCKKYIKKVPVKLPVGTIIADNGDDVSIKYDNNYYQELVVNKLCYFNSKGRYIVYKNKKYYI